MEKWKVSDDGTEYRTVKKNGKWTVIKFKISAAYYSWHEKCGFCHSCYKAKTEDGHFCGCEYDKEGEYNYCPRCGEKMIL